MDTVTKCYVEDQIKNYMQQFNPKESVNFSEEMYRLMLMTSDRIQCCNRYVWEGLPGGFTSQDIETMLYSWGSICCFIENDSLIFSPYSLVGDLDKKGQLEKIQPITLDGKAHSARKRCYNKNTDFEFLPECAILINDYTGAIQNNKIVSRETLNRTTTINDEVKSYKILLYNIMLSIKKMVITCDSEEQSKIMIKQASLLLDPTQPILALTKGSSLSDKVDITQFVDKVEVDDLTHAIDFYNKIRRLNNGIPAPDTFEKKERLISDELKNASIFSNFIMSDGLMNRKIAVDNINKCFNLNLTVDYNEILKEEVLDNGNGLQF